MTSSHPFASGSCPGRTPAAPTRRGFLAGSSAGFGMLALSGLLGPRAAAATSATARPRARNVIFCFMDGGPSHVDLFDPKPMLKKHEGTKIGDTNVSKRLAIRRQSRLVREPVGVSQARGERPVGQ